MAQNTITLILANNFSANSVSNANSATVTLSTSDGPTARQMAQAIIKNGGVWADDGNYYPATAILKIGVS